MTTIEKPLTAAEMAELCHHTTDYVWRQCRGGQWPHTRIGRKYLFTPEQVADIFAYGGVPPTAPSATTVIPVDAQRRLAKAKIR